MAVTVYADGRFEQDAVQVQECPHCGVHSQLLPVSTPDFDMLRRQQPSKVAIGFYCSACGEPRFGRAHVRSIDDTRVELADSIIEVERPREHFAFSYLPENVRLAFDEALQCYSADIFNAFASMCRRTVAASIQALDDVQHEIWSEAVEDIVRIGEIDSATAQTIERLLFAQDDTVPYIDAGQAAVLLEVMKDVLYQCHVRGAKFRAAMKVRRFFAEEHPGRPVTARLPRGAGKPA